MLSRNQLHARLYGFCWTILEQRQPNFNADETKKQEMIVTILKSIEFASTEESEVIHKAIKQISELTYVGTEQDAIKGVLEGKKIIYDNLDPNMLLKEGDVRTPEEEAATSSSTTSSTSTSASSTTSQLSPKTKKILFYAAAAIIVVIIFFNLPFMKEWRTYRDYLNQKITYQEYVDAYPNGKHLQEVTYLWVVDTNYDMQAMCTYLDQWPGGKHAEEINQKYNETWDEEIAKFEQYKSTSKEPKAVAYMEEMLQYMKEHRIFTIGLTINPTIDLKDFEDFDEETQHICELLSSLDDITDLKSKLAPLKSNYTLKDQTQLAQIISDGLQECIDKIFGWGFITVTTRENNVSQKNNMPHLLIDYRIANQYSYEEYNIPEIWTWSETESKKVLGYLLGIVISFDATFSIPNSPIMYQFNDTGDPGVSINNIPNMTEAYRRMTQICFMMFANKMYSNLGLGVAYE